MTIGPKPIGAWSGQKAANCGNSHEFLHASMRYVVIKEFKDFDRHVHPVGEEWSFLGYSFLPYDNGMSFFVSFDDLQEWRLRLQWRAEEQGRVLDRLAEYISPL